MKRETSKRQMRLEEKIELSQFARDLTTDLVSCDSTFTPATITDKRLSRPRSAFESIKEH